MNKYEQALLRLAECKVDVDSLSKQISKQLAACPNHYQPPYELHLSLVYKATTDADYDGWGSGIRRLNASEALAELEGDGDFEELVCPHCAGAQRLIQERKQARIRLGNAKGAITRMALHLHKQSMNNN